MDLALNNPQRLICHSKQTTNQPTKKSATTYSTYRYGKIIA